MICSRLGPRLDTLVAKHGGYEKIPAKAWQQYDDEVKAWQLNRRYGDFYLTTSQQEDEHDKR